MAFACDKNRAGGIANSACCVAQGVLSQPKQQARKHSTREQAKRRTLRGGAPLTSSEDAREQERARDLGMAGRRAPAACMHGGCCNSCACAFSGCSAPNTPPTKGVGD